MVHVLSVPGFAVVAYHLILRTFFFCEKRQ